MLIVISIWFVVVFSFYTGKLEEAKSLCTDYMTILNYLCDKLGSCHSDQVATLLLEGILIMLSGAPPAVTQGQSFHDIVW
jgi:hypothetical protein